MASSDSVHFQPGDVRALVALEVFAFSLPGFLLLAVFTDNRLRYVGIPAIVAIAALLMPRALRISLTVSADGVAIVNFWRTYEFAWPELGAVRVENAGFIAEGMLEAVAFRPRGARKATVAEASIGSRRRREAVLAAVAPHARTWGVPMPEGYGE
jgi:hypothetical protein